jgi:acetylornithine deacetylase
MPNDIVELTSRLVAIDSVNPALVPGDAGEAEIARFVAAWAQGQGLAAEIVEATRGRPSVIVRAAGSGGGRTLLLCGHTDTVNVEAVKDPHVPRVDGDRVYGRGSYDMKAGLAAALISCREVAKLGLAGDVVVAAVADEECDSIGVQEILETVRADAAVVTEPTELEIGIAHKGFVWFDIDVTGRAAHGSRPHLGVDAIVKAGPILTALGELDAALGAHAHPLVGRPSTHASLIDGGVEMSSYPARCVIRLERRTIPGETVADAEQEIDALLDGCRAADPDLRVERCTALHREPLEVDPGDEIVTAVMAAAQSTRRLAVARRRELLGRLGTHRGRGHPDGALRPGRRGRARGRRVGEHRADRSGDAHSHCDGTAALLVITY